MAKGRIDIHWAWINLTNRKTWWSVTSVNNRVEHTIVLSRSRPAAHKAAVQFAKAHNVELEDSDGE